MKKDLCVFCNGVTEEKTITVNREWGGKIVVFQNVPAKACKRCGEPYFSISVMREMERKLQKKTKPKMLVKVPVYSL